MNNKHKPTTDSHPPALQRRGFLGGLLAAAAGGTLATLASPASAASRAEVALDRAKWAMRNHDMVAQMIAEHGKLAPGYQSTKRPYAVFDWDNTSIMNDCEEALLMYQINTLSFKMNPAEFAAITRQNVPPGPFSKDFKNAAGQIVDLDSICADLDADYAFLHANYKGMAGSKSLEEVTATTEFQDFRAKLYYLYEAVNDTHGVNVGYPWVIYFFANMSVAEVSALAEASNDAALGAALAKVKYTSPADRPGKAGVVSVSHFHGIRLCTEIATLMDSLRRNGIDVYVCTASLEDVVAVFATHAKYGYHVTRENVIGLRLERNGQAFRNAYLKDWPLTWGPGKTVAIKQVLVAQKGYGPLFVAGDSDGDYDMLRDFPETRFGLIVNRMKNGKIGELSKLAADQISTDKPRFLLQGRQESTGNWVPAETSIKYGKTAPQLLTS
ncbi:haloacid dehalogenase-like hydrolase [Herbaspirillum sp. AP02]|uniref:HAD family hydrolase n=1 Tax=unclassified Herbaspirillum TaxID=2624150 RepID=UPI0015D9A4C1|nr:MULTISPECIES: HAD family hydrolase [unclassified Herbaspirillum]MBG7617904.1 haloacid dehalogenase-like hydrolase [Herbaspirillum sp. AP02]NZD70091.1 haloacid dehalogenase-like hydrolase [Herbaspirillum sp. AP21]